eukprot:10236597-Heterocapsa_arctica.AAC.1
MVVVDAKAFQDGFPVLVEHDSRVFNYGVDGDIRSPRLEDASDGGEDEEITGAGSAEPNLSLAASTAEILAGGSSYDQ